MLVFYSFVCLNICLFLCLLVCFISSCFLSGLSDNEEKGFISIQQYKAGKGECTPTLRIYNNDNDFNIFNDLQPLHQNCNAGEASYTSSLQSLDLN